MSQETVYLFRHALLRDAAYHLQLPSSRARLHGLAFALIEALCGGRPPETPPLDAAERVPFVPHPTDAFALDLAGHARGASTGEVTAVPQAALLLYLRRAAEVADRQFRPEAEICWLEIGDLSTGALRAMALRNAGNAARRRGDPRKAEKHFGSALASFSEVGDRRGAGLTLGDLAIVYRETGRVEQAERGYEQSLAIHREVGDRRSEGNALGNLAGVYSETGRVEQAESALQQALAIHREAGNRRSEGVALGNLAVVYRGTGRVDQAERTHEHALAIHREVGDRWSEGIALGNLALLYHQTGRAEQAERTNEQALDIDRELGNRRFEGLALGNLASVYQATGRVGLAARTYEQALAIHRDVGDRRFEGFHSCDFALCLLLLSKRAEAEALWRQGTAFLKRVSAWSDLEGRRAAMREACSRAGIAPLSEDPNGAP